MPCRIRRTVSSGTVSFGPMRAIMALRFGSISVIADTAFALRVGKYAAWRHTGATGMAGTTPVPTAAKAEPAALGAFAAAEAALAEGVPPQLIAYAFAAIAMQIEGFRIGLMPGNPEDAFRALTLPLSTHFASGLTDGCVSRCDRRSEGDRLN